MAKAIRECDPQSKNTNSKNEGNKKGTQTPRNKAKMQKLMNRGTPIERERRPAGYKPDSVGTSVSQESISSSSSNNIIPKFHEQCTKFSTANSMRTTVDSKESDFFNNLSNVWWNEKMEPLRDLNRLIMPYICSQIVSKGTADASFEVGDQPLQGLNVLEVGCGGGFLSEMLARSGCNLTSIDIAADLVKVAKHHAENDPTLPKIKYLNEAIEDHCKTNYQKYDVVISSFVLEHVNDHDYFISCCSKCVKPDGALFIGAVAKTFWAWFVMIFLAEFVFDVIPRGTHVMEKCITFAATKEIIQSNGFNVIKTRGISLNVLTKRHSWVPFNSIIYLTHAIRFALKIVQKSCNTLHICEMSQKTTIDPEEREHFNKIGENWWSGGEAEILGKLNVIVVPYVCSQVLSTGITKTDIVDEKAPLQGLNVLEVGCGGGIFSEKLARSGCNLTAIDVAGNLIEVAKRRAAADSVLSRINYKEEAIEDHCKKNYQKYDVVISNFVLEHVSDHDYFIKSCAECVKPNGSLIISAIAKTFWAWLVVIFLSEFVLRILPKETHRYKNFIEAWKTEKLIKTYGFQIEKTRGIMYDFFFKRGRWVPLNCIAYVTHSIRQQQSINDPEIKKNKGKSEDGKVVENVILRKKGPNKNFVRALGLVLDFFKQGPFFEKNCVLYFLPPYKFDSSNTSDKDEETKKIERTRDGDVKEVHILRAQDEAR
ncbi:hypothetical protein FQA39_LY01080 [Lamprigera yunnana]|nr:hypothetical protein FQA39_LY01080 [Lamprigera yunnana]